MSISEEYFMWIKLLQTNVRWFDNFQTPATLIQN